MTRVSIDDRISETGYDSAEKLADVVQAVTSSLPPNRIVSTILLDGRLVPKHEEASALQNSLREIRELQIRTADTEILAASGLDTALCTVERVQRSLRNAMQSFHSGNQKEAIHCFGRCLEGLERFLEQIISVRYALKIDFSRVESQGRKLNSVERDLLALVGTLVDLQEKQDFETFADTVEDEVLTNLAYWIHGLRSLSVSAASNA